MEANPWGFLFATSLQRGVRKNLRVKETEESHHSELFRALRYLQSMRVGKEEGDHVDDEGKIGRCFLDRCCRGGRRGEALG